MKRLKDPIYGYIDVAEEIIDSIIDTAAFQRLRSVIQTSYSPLYASAVHNRFVHSLGVYHLGSLVSQSFLSSVESIEAINTLSIKPYIRIFEYACLLHDVGHAPFSHTGEEFYLSADSSRDPLHKEIVSLTGDTILEDEIKSKNYGAAPHELMSVVVALKRFPELFKTADEKSFFARCILGYSYVKNVTAEKSFLNCMISMLNSSVIDVDKLDYLIRDAYITGFDTVSIDYMRLLRSVKVFYEDDQCRLVFTKAAISVIENVVFAHDAERKWIQNHPVVLYDAYLLRHALEKLNSLHGVFDYDSLTSTGKPLNENLRVALLNDGDIMFLMKNITDDAFIDEYEQGLDFDFLIIKANQFNSGFGKLAFENIEIEFPGLKSPCNFKKVTNALSAQKSERDNFYYLFVRRKNGRTAIDVSSLALRLGKLVLEEAFS